jgi:predicted ATPase/class 3 adenylate cyclase
MGALARAEGTTTMPREPESTHSFLLTDIEGSTQSWERYAAPMHDALDAHDDILASVIDRHGGELINHTGDGVCAAFDTPASALRAAVDAQLALRDIVIGRAGVLKVRMGVHHGKVVHSGDRMFGPTLNRCARIMSAAHGGQIVVSGTAVELLADNAVPELTLVELGWHHLRGVTEPIRLYQVQAESLEREFPPLRGAGAAQPHNLPLASTSFVGRVDALTALDEQLERHRLVTLLGAGGSGKTRLAAEAASRWVQRYVGGVWFVAFADVGGDDSVVPAVARALGIQEHPGRSREDTVIDRLQDAQLLLVIDSCEHVASGVRAFLDVLLPAARAVRVMATSQVRLGVTGEAAFPVEPLSLESHRAALVEQSDAMQLFVERAQLASPAFEPDTATRSAIARVCSRLDGLPLAIELAAARVRVLSVQEIERRLDDRFRLLAERHGAVARHRTLRSAVDWSYDLLTTEQQRSLDQLSVFRGDFALDAAAAILQVDELDAIGALADLNDHSLLEVAASPGDTRYRLLDTIRAYADEHLRTAGSAIEARARHRAWVLDLAGRPHAEHLGPKGPEWHDRLDAEYANILLALETAHADGVPAEALTLCKQLWLWFWLRGHLSDGSEACGRALDACSDAAPADRAPALLGKGLLAFAQLDVPTASAALNEVMDLDGGGDQLLVGWCMLFSAQLAAVRGEAGVASEQLPVALAIAEEVAPPGHLAGAYYWASSASLMLGDRENADRYLDTSLATARRVRAPYVLTRFLPVLGKRRLAVGDEYGAIELFEEALETSRSTRDRAGVARAATILAELHLEHGGFDRAEELLEEAVPIVLREIDDQVFGCKVSLALASLHRQRGSFPEAQEHLDRALAAGSRLTSWKSSSDPYREQALLFFDLGNLHAADQELAKSEKQARQSGHAERLGRCLLVRAEVDALRGRVGEASAALSEVAGQAAFSVVPPLATSVLHTRGRVAAAQARYKAAEDAFRGALLERWHRGHAVRAVESAEGLASARAHAGHASSAAQLLGAVAAERHRLSAARPPVWAVALDRIEAEIRSEIGSVAFQQAFDEGGRLGLTGLAKVFTPAERG